MGLTEERKRFSDNELRAMRDRSEEKGWSSTVGRQVFNAVIDEALARGAALAAAERVADENYSDLLDQMDEAWGATPESLAKEIGRVEINAFLESRFVHKPTTRLREENARLRAALEDIFRWEFGGIRPDEHRTIPRQMYDAVLAALSSSEAVVGRYLTPSRSSRCERRLCKPLG